MPLSLPLSAIIALALALAALAAAAILVQRRFRHRLRARRASLAALLGGRLLAIGVDPVGVEGRLDGQAFRLHNVSRGRGGIGLRIDLDVQQSAKAPFRLVGGMRDPHPSVAGRKFWQGFRLLEGASVETRNLIERSSELRAELERASRRAGGISLEFSPGVLRYEQLDFGTHPPQALAALTRALARLAAAAGRGPPERRSDAQSS